MAELRIRVDEDYPRTLAVIGRFNTNEGDKPVFVFDTNDDEADGKLSVADVFDTLKPALGQSAGADLTINESAYKAISLTRPESGSGNFAMPLPFDSMLLDNHSGTEQDVGGTLVAGLLRDLDVVTRFTGLGFPAALMEVARRYLNTDVNRHLPDGVRISQDRIGDLIRDPVDSDAVLRVLTAFESDLPGAERGLRTTLDARELKAPDETIRQKMTEAILKSLRALREDVLLSGKADASWKVIMGIDPANEPTRTDMEWVNGSIENKKYDFHPGDIETIPPSGGGLVDYYQLYMRHSGNIHKFVRSPVMHSYVFMWLMSKYQDLIGGNHEPTAKAAYEMGVKGAGNARIPQESNEVLAGHSAKVSDGAEKALDEAIQSHELDPDTAERMKRSASPIKEASARIYNPKDRFAREELLELMEELFEEAAGAVTGTLSEIQKEGMEYVKRYEPWCSRLREALSPGKGAKEDDSPTKKTLLQAIQNLAKQAEESGDEDISDDLKEAAKVAGEKFPKKEGGKLNVAELVKIRTDVMRTFAHQTGYTPAKRYADSYISKKAQLDEERVALLAAYRLAKRMEGQYQEVTNGKDALLSRITDAEAMQGTRARKVQEKLKELGAEVPPPQTITPPSKVRESLKTTESHDGPDIQIVDDNSNEVVAKGRIYADATKIEVEFVSLSDSSDPAPKLRWEAPAHGSSKSLRDMHEIDPGGTVEDTLRKQVKRQKQQKEDEKAVEQLPEFGKVCEELKKVYIGKTPTELDDGFRATIKRTQRACTLAEYFASAPDAESRLGDQNISLIVPLLIDIVKVLGDLDNGRLKAAGPDPESTRWLGPKRGDRFLNLSQYVRIPDDENSDDNGPSIIARTLQYHETLCQSVGQVGEQLQDVSDLRAIVAAMPRTGRLIVVNRTLKEYANILHGNNHSLSADHHPSVVYLPHAATAGEHDAGEIEIWDAYKTDLKNRLEGGLSPGAQLSVPMIISADGTVNDDEGQCSLPVGDITALQNVKFRSRSETSGDAGAKNRHDMKEGLVVEGARYVASLPAAMAVAAFAKERSLGHLSDAQTSNAFFAQFKETTGGLPFKLKEDVVALLRRLWTESESGKGCLAAFLLARIVSLVLVWKGNSGNATFGNFLRESGLDPAPADADDNNGLRRHALEALLKAAFFEFPGNLRLEFKSARQVGANPDNLIHVANQQINLSNDNVVICKLAGRDIELSRNVRAQFGDLLNI